MNVMTVDGFQAKIEYDAETDMFRGEILGLSEPLPARSMV